MSDQRAAYELPRLGEIRFHREPLDSAWFARWQWEACYLVTEDDDGNRGTASVTGYAPWRWLGWLMGQFYGRWCRVFG